MAAATTDMGSAAEVGSEDIEAALTYSLAEALCAAATNAAFLPDACAQAATAYKHTAFAKRLGDHAGAMKRVEAAASMAELRLVEALGSAAPMAQRFIDAAGIKSRPRYVPPKAAGARGIIEARGGAVKSRHAETMEAVWTLRYGLAYFAHAACESIQHASSYQTIATQLGKHLRFDLPNLATDLYSAIRIANSLSDEQPAKKLRISKK